MQSHFSSSLTSVLLVTHNQLEYTKLCMESIRRHTTEPYELVFVDNGSTDRTVEFMKAVGSRQSTVEESPYGSPPQNVTLAVNAENRGFPAAVNQGIRAATGEQILLINNDTIVTACWLNRMLRVLHSDPQIGMVGPCSNFVSGPQQVGVSYAGRGPVSIEQFDAAKLDEFAELWSEANDRHIQETDRLVGFCLLIRREVVEKIGLLDERFGIGNFEDDDYCRRAREAGYRLVIARDAFVHHFGGATFRASGIDFGALMQRNERLFREKWAQEGSRELAVGSREEEGSRELGIGSRGATTAYSLLPTAFCMPTASLCMIARDNERTIRAALESIRPWVDEMVVVDTGSTDGTPEIAAELGARVFHFPWCDDFSAARNESIRHARGQWVFWMDTDDTIDPENGAKLQQLVHRVARDPPAGILGFLMKVRCPGSGANGPQGPVLPGQHGAVEVDHVKLFRNLPELRFEGRIHEQILMAIRRAGGTVAWTDIVIEHSGSDQSPEGRAKKLERDLRILDLEYKERPDHPFVLFNLGMTHDQAGNYEKAIGYLWQSIGRSGDEDSHLRKAYALLVSSYRQLGRHVTIPYRRQG